MLKRELRQQIRQQKSCFTKEQLTVWSQQIVEELLSHPQVAAAQTILAYYSLDDEVDTHALVHLLHQQGKTVLLPKVIDGERMELRRYTGEQSLRQGAFGIMEPTGDFFTDYPEIDLALIPGMAFDRNGNRLGRGKGYYDRLLPLLTNAHRLGICFPFQLVPAVPTSEHDIPMDAVLSKSL